MHGQIRAHAVAGAVIVIEAGFPKRLARKGVERRAGGALGEAHRGERDMAFEHAGEAVAHFGGGLAHDHGAGDIGGAVGILAAGIDQEDLVALRSSRLLERVTR